MIWPVEEDKALEKQGDTITEAACELEEWIARFRESRDGTPHAITDAHHHRTVRVRRQAQELRRATMVPASVAVYGASQCGKSCLIGRLVEGQAGKSGLGLSEEYSAPERLSFIDDLNPKRGGEATAVVTRFTVAERLQHKNPDFPVIAILLSDADLVKSLAIGFHSECKPDKPVLTNEDVEKAFNEAGNTQGSGEPIPMEWQRDVQDAFDWLSRTSYGWSKVDGWLLRKLCSTRRLSEKSRTGIIARLFWDGWPEITSLYEELVQLREKLGDVNELLVDWGGARFLLDVGIPGKVQIPALGGELRWDDFRCERSDGLWKVSRGLRGGLSCPLELLQGLVCELQVPVVPGRVSHEAQAVLKKGDLLDIPGARAGAGEAAMTRQGFQKDPAMFRRELLKRGKVGLLFHKYASELQIDVLVYLQEYGNLEARGELVPRIKAWGRAKFGEEWPDRVPGDEVEYPSLFVGMTWFDDTLRRLEEKTKENVFHERLNTQFVNYFGEWVHNWGGKNGIFNNIFWLRLALGKDERFDRSRLSESKKSYLESEDVRKYVRDAEAKWDSVVDDANRGLTGLFKAVAEKLSPLHKRTKLDEDIHSLWSELSEVARELYIDESPFVEAERKRALVNRLTEALSSCQTDRTEHIAEVLDKIAVPNEAIEEQRQLWLPAARHEQVRMWLEAALKNWGTQISQDTRKTIIADEDLQQLVACLCEYLRGKEEEEIVEFLCKLGRLRQPTGREAANRCRRMVMTDVVIRPGVRHRQHQDPDLPLNSEDADTAKLFVDKWKQNLMDALVTDQEGAAVPQGNKELAGLMRQWKEEQCAVK